MTNEPYVFPDNRRGTVGGLAHAAKEALAARKAPPATRQRRRKDVAENARALAGNVAETVKAKPIPPLLIALGVGVAAALLFSKRARGAALTAGTFALDQYRRRR